MPAGTQEQEKVDGGRLEARATIFTEPAATNRVAVITAKNAVAHFLIKVIAQKEESVLHRLFRIVRLDAENLLPNPRNRAAVACVSLADRPQESADVHHQKHLEFVFEDVDGIAIDFRFGHAQRLFYFRAQ